MSVTWVKGAEYMILVIEKMIVVMVLLNIVGMIMVTVVPVYSHCIGRSDLSTGRAVEGQGCELGGCSAENKVIKFGIFVVVAPTSSSSPHLLFYIMS